MWSLPGNPCVCVYRRICIPASVYSYLRICISVHMLWSEPSSPFPALSLSHCYSRKENEQKDQHGKASADFLQQLCLRVCVCVCRCASVYIYVCVGIIYVSPVAYYCFHCGLNVTVSCCFNRTFCLFLPSTHTHTRSM